MTYQLTTRMDVNHTTQGRQHAPYHRCLVGAAQAALSWRHALRILRAGAPTNLKAWSVLCVTEQRLARAGRSAANARFGHGHLWRLARGAARPCAAASRRPGVQASRAAGRQRLTSGFAAALGRPREPLLALHTLLAALLQASQVAVSLPLARRASQLPAAASDSCRAAAEQIA
jgi:hypothetical protein